MTEPEVTVFAPVQIDAAVIGVAGEIPSEMRFHPEAIARLRVADGVAVAVGVAVGVGVDVGVDVGVATTVMEKATEDEPEYPEYPPSCR